eukprot:m.453469 g.453469  ORF g.453469 m.453469 type:complete len:358 (+) comp20505_c0_seq1:110-1183(+)
MFAPLLAGLVGLAAAHVDISQVLNTNSTNTDDPLDLKHLSTLPSLESTIGPRLDSDGKHALVAIAEPLNGCSPIEHAPQGEADHFVLIERGNCTFGTKIYNAEQAGFYGVIVYNNMTGNLVQMTYSNGEHDIMIPSVFVSQSSGEYIKMKIEELGSGAVYAEMFADLFVVRSFLITFVTIIAAISIIFTLFLFYRRHTIVANHQPKARMTRKQVLKLPKRSFKPEDADETCCICLDDYARGDTILTLPCKHYFHEGCIRPWLQDEQRLCPICKRDPLATPEATEDTPLLSPDIAEVEDGNDRPRTSSAVSESASVNQDVTDRSADRANSASPLPTGRLLSQSSSTSLLSLNSSSTSM